MTDTQDLLVEIGTEELPPASLRRLAMALRDECLCYLSAQGLNSGESEWYATPRRLAFVIKRLAVAQADRSERRRGPALRVAFDAAGRPGRAAEGFAAACGVSVDQLATLETDKGSWLIRDTLVKGKDTAALLPAMLDQALKRLPIARRMRWGSHEAEFARPVRWALILFGETALEHTVLGVRSGAFSYGHRFHHPAKIRIERPADYAATLAQTGRVVADFKRRRALIEAGAARLARQRRGRALLDPALLDEVTALVEWPAPFIGEFKPDFLKLPQEVLIAAMQGHQKYFPVVAADGRLLACFIGVANIDSAAPEAVKQGNERVIAPRLEDAAFFWERDLKHGLANHIPALERVVYQRQLGTLADRRQRLIEISAWLAGPCGADPGHTRRAAELCLCDLLTEMVGEFPELEGVMGRYYAEAGGEAAEVAQALAEQYRPRFAKDALPESAIGRCLALAARIDTLVGIFALGKAPSGDKDPFGLRRAAIGLLRVIIEGGVDIDLSALIEIAAGVCPAAINAAACGPELSRFLLERLRHYYLDNGVAPDSFEAVLATGVRRPLDFDRRLKAVTEFRKLAAAQSLAAANKRIVNILRKSGAAGGLRLDPALLIEPEERRLAEALARYRADLAPLLRRRDYRAALCHLAGIRAEVDAFFEQARVMCEDETLRNNRLALLHSLNRLFLETADISRLQG